MTSLMSLKAHNNDMTCRIEDFQNDPNWKISLGEKLGKIHFRNGHFHAVCDPVSGYCDVHYDAIDPYKSITSLFNHIKESNLGKRVLIACTGLILDQVLTGGVVRKSLIKLPSWLVFYFD